VETAITDYNTSGHHGVYPGSPTLPSGWTTPTGGGLDLTTNYGIDAVGRATSVQDPAGNMTYVVYDDVNHAARTYPGWNSTTHTTTGPTRVVRYDRAGGYT
jgi:hypothetical protein